MRARTIKATIPTSSRGQLGGVVNRDKPLSTLMAIARGKDEQLVDFSGFYVVSRVLTWTDLWGEWEAEVGVRCICKGCLLHMSESGMILWRKKMNRWWSTMNGVVVLEEVLWRMRADTSVIFQVWGMKEKGSLQAFILVRSICHCFYYLVMLTVELSLLSHLTQNVREYHTTYGNT